MHPPEAVPPDDGRLRGLCEHHFGGSDGVPDLGGRECAVQGLAAVDQEVGGGEGGRER